ncbi:MAG: hypothetical protein RLZ98_1017 [Pseudomonadota bacterium]|jgi:tripartite-type tricarboxylate transporter receptor subunit TctC
MPNFTRTIRALALAAAAGAVVPLIPVSPATAAEPSWKGKVLSIYIRSGAGGGYDYYGRLVGRHMQKHLDGNPTIRIINMPGAGGIVAANFLMTRAKKDGTDIAVLSRALTIAQLLKAKGVQYDAGKLTAIGSPAGETWVWVVRGDHPVKSLSALRKWKGDPLKFSGTGKGAASYQRVKMLEFDGYPVSVITGYSGTEEKNLAVARGEVQATSGSYESMRAFIRDQKLTIVGRMGNHEETRHAESARDIATPKGRPMILFAEAPEVAARPFFGPPDLKPEVTKALRTAFTKAMQDPALIAEAAKANKTLSYTSAEDLEAIIKETLAAPAEIVEAFKAMGGGSE